MSIYRHSSGVIEDILIDSNFEINIIDTLAADEKFVFDYLKNSIFHSFTSSIWPWHISAFLMRPWNFFRKLYSSAAEVADNSRNRFYMKPLTTNQFIQHNPSKMRGRRPTFERFKCYGIAKFLLSPPDSFLDVR